MYVSTHRVTDVLARFDNVLLTLMAGKQKGGSICFLFSCFCDSCIAWPLTSRGLVDF